MNSNVDIDSITWIEGKVRGFRGKALIDMNAGAVKLVRIDPGAEYPQHRHPDKTEYAYVLDGNLEFTVGKDTYEGKAGDFYIFPRNTVHAMRNSSDQVGLILIGAIKQCETVAT